MKVIAGLGNPGEKYRYTRHNAGFMVLEKLLDKNSINEKLETKFNAVIAKGMIEGQEVLTIRPLTYMNLSGEAVAKILHYYKIPPSELFVVYDDISIDLGKLRFRPSGSDGGHNGIKSIINNLGGFKDFPRLKIGIGPQPAYLSSEVFVLQKFSDEEKQLLDKTINISIEAIECFLSTNIDNASNKYNGINLAG